MTTTNSNSVSSSPTRTRLTVYLLRFVKFNIFCFFLVIGVCSILFILSACINFNRYENELEAKKNSEIIYDNLYFRNHYYSPYKYHARNMGNRDQFRYQNRSYGAFMYDDNGETSDFSSQNSSYNNYTRYNINDHKNSEMKHSGTSSNLRNEMDFYDKPYDIDTRHDTKVLNPNIYQQRAERNFKNRSQYTNQQNSSNLGKRTNMGMAGDNSFGLDTHNSLSGLGSQPTGKPFNISTSHKQ